MRLDTFSTYVNTVIQGTVHHTRLKVLVFLGMPWRHKSPPRSHEAEICDFPAQQWTVINGFVERPKCNKASTRPFSCPPKFDTAVSVKKAVEEKGVQASIQKVWVKNIPLRRTSSMVVAVMKWLSNGDYTLIDVPVQKRERKTAPLCR